MIAQGKHRRGEMVASSGRLPRVRRRLFAFVSASSLLLLVLVCVLWMRSYFTSEYLVLRAGPSMGQWHVTAQSSQGACSLSGVQRVFAYASHTLPPRYGSRLPLDLLEGMPISEDSGVGLAFCRAGFGLFWSDGILPVGFPLWPPPSHPRPMALYPMRSIVLPHWALALILSVFPGEWLRRHRKRAAPPAGTP
jgi:hypothetical protein